MLFGSFIFLINIIKIYNNLIPKYAKFIKKYDNKTRLKTFLPLIPKKNLMSKSKQIKRKVIQLKIDFSLKKSFRLFEIFEE